MTNQTDHIVDVNNMVAEARRHAKVDGTMNGPVSRVKRIEALCDAVDALLAENAAQAERIAELEAALGLAVEARNTFARSAGFCGVDHMATDDDYIRQAREAKP